MSKAYFVHERGLCESDRIGEGTRIWAFAHVLPGAIIGRDCNICDHVFIENQVTVGDRVTVKSGVQLWDGVFLEDDVFVGPNATFINDPFPRSRQRPERFIPTVVRQGASIGANATLLCGVTIGTGAMIGAGAVVTADVPANAIATGNPARIVGYVDTSSESASAGLLSPGSSEPVGVGGVTICHLAKFSDPRGNLVPVELERDLPFVPKRFFVVRDVPSRDVRGEHAHRALHQFLVCLAGECSLVVDDGNSRREIRLDAPSVGVYLPPRVWAVQYRFSPEAVLLVLASHAYDASDYIRDYNEFLRECRPQRRDEA